MGGQFSPAAKLRPYMIRRSLEGASRTQIAKELGVTANTVAGQLDRERKKPTIKPAVPPRPPSAGMLALAAFDPVIARAAAQRTRQAA